MKKIMAALLVVLLLWLGAVAEAGSTKTNVGTFTQTNVFFKPPGWDKDVGGGYTISTSATGEDRTSLDFSTESRFDFTGGRTVSIETGAQSNAFGAKSFGMLAALTQTYPTENGYRSSTFQTHSYTFMPYLFAIQQLAGGQLSGDSAGGYNDNAVTVGDNKYNFGASSKLDGDLISHTTLDPSLSSVSGFGWENGFDYIDSVNECGMDYTGTLSTDSTLLVT